MDADTVGGSTSHIRAHINCLLMSNFKCFEITMRKKWQRQIIEGEGYIEEAC